jgi:hypothetical protein
MQVLDVTGFLKYAVQVTGLQGLALRMRGLAHPVTRSQVLVYL